MSPDTKHKLGAAAMWGGVALAAAIAFLIVPTHPVAGIAAFAVSCLVSGAGVRAKKKHCPRCRDSICKLP
jgi:hypothetical protein